MTRDDITRLALEAGWEPIPTVRMAFAGFDLERFAALVAALAQQEQAITPAELSAALGWPGGISTPVLDKGELLKMVAQPEPTFQDHSIPLGRRTQEQPIQPVAWLTDRQTMYFDKEDARRDCDGFIQPLYTHPAEPEPPPEPLHPDKIRAEFRDIDRHTLPGEMTLEDWFEAGVRYAERQHEIV
jgi:hypothetical protein